MDKSDSQHSRAHIQDFRMASLLRRVVLVDMPPAENGLWSSKKGYVRQSLAAGLPRLPNKCHNCLIVRIFIGNFGGKASLHCGFVATESESHQLEA